jgi:hypothetical protein
VRHHFERESPVRLAPQAEKLARIHRSEANDARVARLGRGRHPVAGRRGVARRTAPVVA